MIGLYGCTDPNIKLDLPEIISKDISADSYNDKIQLYRFKNNIFFPQKQPIFLENIGIIADGIIIVDKNIEDCIQNGEKTLKQLLQLFKDKGEFFVKDIKTGMFNIIIIEKNNLKIINDWFGTYSLYYTQLPTGDLIFSNNSDFISKFGGEIDWISITEFLKYGYILGNKTPWKNIHKLPPGSILTYDLTNKIIDISKYHTFKPISKAKESLESYLEKTEQLLYEACQRLYSPSLKYSIGLTGGLDSRLIMANWPNRNNLHSWTAATKEEDTEIVEILIKSFGIPHHCFHIPKYLSALELNKVLDFLDPLEGRVSHVLKESYPNVVRENAKIELTGVFGEILGGQYLWSLGNITDKVKSLFFTNEQAEKYELKIIAKLLNNSLSSFSDQVLKTYLTEDTTLKLAKDDELEHHIQNILKEYDLSEINPYSSTEIFNLLNRGLYFYGSLPTKRMKVEQITPYADYKLIENIINYPIKIRLYRRLMLGLLKNKYGKWGKIKTTFSLVPPSYPYFFQKILASYKTFLERHLNKKEIVIPKEFLGIMEKELKRSNLIKKEINEEIITMLQGTPAKNELLFRLFLFCVWYKKYVETNRRN